MATIQQLKEKIDLDDLAERLGLKRGQGKNANYASPHHEDKTPSLSVYFDRTSGEQKWKDFSAQGAGGSCIDLVMYVENIEAGEAVKVLHEMYGFPFDKPAHDQNKKQSTVEFIATQCKGNDNLVYEYLTGRGIAEEVISHALKKGTLGFNTWCSDSVPAGETGHHGPAVAFIVKTLNPGHVVAIDKRFLNPELNGGVKTQSTGEKSGYVWTADINKLKRAHNVYAVESAINALSVDTCKMGSTAAIALRGTGNVDTVDFRFLAGKRVMICLDNDKPTHDGKYPGQEAAWRLHERLTSSCTWKTRQCSLLGGLVEFSETWPRSGTMRDGECWEQPTLAPHTSATGSGLLPTPTATTAKQGANSTAGGSSHGRPLLHKAALNWPTLTASEHTGAGHAAQGGLNLRTAVSLWPTPTRSTAHKEVVSSQGYYNLVAFAKMFPTPLSSEWKGAPTLEKVRERALESKRGVRLCEHLARNGDNGQLNPTWVEWLMGWPLGWTDLKPLAMDKYQQWLQQHGDC